MTYPHDQEYSIRKPGLGRDPDLAEPGAEQAMADPADPASPDPDSDVVVAEIVDSDAVSAGADAAQRSTNLGPQWHDIQARFVDDPRDAVQLAAEAADAALKALASSLHQQRARLLPPATDPASHDTEQLRSALRQYRQFCQGIAELGGRMPRAGTMAR
jgi:hypothetical protein